MPALGVVVGVSVALEDGVVVVVIDGRPALVARLVVPAVDLELVKNVKEAAETDATAVFEAVDFDVDETSDDDSAPEAVDAEADTVWLTVTDTSVAVSNEVSTLCVGTTAVLCPAQTLYAAELADAFNCEQSAFKQISDVSPKVNP